MFFFQWKKVSHYFNCSVCGYKLKLKYDLDKPLIDSYVWFSCSTRRCKSWKCVQFLGNSVIFAICPHPRPGPRALSKKTKKWETLKLALTCDQTSAKGFSALLRRLSSCLFYWCIWPTYSKFAHIHKNAFFHLAMSRRRLQKGRLEIFEQRSFISSDGDQCSRPAFKPLPALCPASSLRGRAPANICFSPLLVFWEDLFCYLRFFGKDLNCGQSSFFQQKAFVPSSNYP